MPLIPHRVPMGLNTLVQRGPTQHLSQPALRLTVRAPDVVAACPDKPQRPLQARRGIFPMQRSLVAPRLNVPTGQEELFSASASHHSSPVGNQARLDQLVAHREETRLYRGLQLKRNEITRPAYRDADRLGPLQRLGCGSFNTVYSVMLRGPQGQITQGVFKPLQSQHNGFALQASGVPFNNPQIAMRNLATLGYAKLLGFNVIADTQIALFTLPQGEGSSPELTLGLLMERAQGRPGVEMSPNLMKKPPLLRELTKLQLLDHLTAQGDRHSSNYFVHYEHASDQAKITGIDNDQCFGPLVKEPLSIVNDGSRSAKLSSHMGSFKTVQLPAVVDYEMFQAITKLEPPVLHAMLQDMLSADEVSAANERLACVKRHLHLLNDTGYVIGRDGWDAPGVQSALSPANSYAMRECSRSMALYSADTFRVQPPGLRRNIAQRQGHASHSLV